MSEFYKVSGKKIKLDNPAKDLKANDWKLEWRPGGFVVAIHLQTGERKRFFAHESKGNLSLSIGGKLFYGKLESVSRTGVKGAASDADLKAQFPGKVRKLLVQSQQNVKEGEPLLLIEAMKMEFSIKAPYDGVVKQVHVKEGQQLNPGDKFLDLEPKK